eukprot:s1824_g1.t1
MRKSSLNVELPRYRRVSHLPWPRADLAIHERCHGKSPGPGSELVRRLEPESDLQNKEISELSLEGENGDEVWWHLALHLGAKAMAVLLHHPVQLQATLEEDLGVSTCCIAAVFPLVLPVVAVLKLVIVHPQEDDFMDTDEESEVEVEVKVDLPSEESLFGSEAGVLDLEVSRRSKSWREDVAAPGFM